MTASSGVGAVVDALVFSSVWVAAAAAALAAAAAFAMRVEPSAPLLLLCFCGTLVVYGVDRLRDLPRDRETAPVRSRFVSAHRDVLIVATALAALASAVLALVEGPRVVALLVPVLLAGLFHRRLKRFGWWKPLYVGAAWTTVVVGLPAVHGPAPRHVAWVAGVVGATIFANVVASNLRDAEALSARFGARVPLGIARALSAAGVVTGALGPAPVRPLVAIPLATLAALAGFRAEERYGLVVVDGALLVGALVALPLVR